MFDINLEIYENDWDNIKSASEIYKDDLRALLKLNDNSNGRKENMLIYINELYVELVKWLSNNFNNEFVEFYYTDPVEFEDYLEIKTQDNKIYIDMPGNKFLVEKTEALAFGKKLLSLIEDMFSTKGEEGIKYFNLLKESVK